MIDGINDNEEIGELLNTAIEYSGNEFAMGYDDSGCFWRFFAGSRGSGSMMEHATIKFQSESPDIREALIEYLDYLKARHVN